MLAMPSPEETFGEALGEAFVIDLDEGSGIESNSRLRTLTPRWRPMGAKAAAPAPVVAEDEDDEDEDDEVTVMRREEDLLAEARVFAKYGLKEKAFDRVQELLQASPKTSKPWRCWPASISRVAATATPFNTPIRSPNWRACKGLGAVASIAGRAGQCRLRHRRRPGDPTTGRQTG